MTDPGRIPPNQVWDSLTDDQKAYAARVMAVHAGGIEQMDKDIGRVIQYLKDTAQYDNTFIMFTSDNGSSEPVEVAEFRHASGVDLTHAKEFVAGINNSLSNLGSPTSDINYGAWGTYLAVSPLSGFKTSMYEGGIRPPLLIKAPQSLQSPNNNASSNLIKSFVYVTDFTPTILELAGVSHPSTYNGTEVHALMGKSIKPLLDGTVDVVHPANETIPAEMFNTTVVRMGDWKGIHQASDKSGVWHLYNLATDLGENTDVADQHPDIMKKLISAYDKYAQDVGIVIPTSGPFATLFPPITANNTQTINLTNMFVPGYPWNATESGQVPPGA
jgi:arylsulfatase A-like enzyme